jgi:hypothetical protein
MVITCCATSCNTHCQICLPLQISHAHNKSSHNIVESTSSFASFIRPCGSYRGHLLVPFDHVVSVKVGKDGKISIQPNSTFLPRIRLALDTLELIVPAQPIDPLCPLPRINAPRLPLTLSARATKVAVPLTIRTRVLDESHWVLVCGGEVGALLDGVDAVVCA